MQKIFRKYAQLIITSAILTILLINFFISAYSLQKQQYNTFNAKIDQVINTMENNQNDVEEINRNLDEDYLTRARAAEYVIGIRPTILESRSELLHLANLLNVDEVHIIDENGIITHSSVSRYIGLDFRDDPQTREFLWILDNYTQEAYLIQEARPNAAEGKTMKYVGVARKDQKGIVQVGLEPVRQLEAQRKNTYDYIFSIFPTEEGEEFFAVDCKTDQLLGHSGNEYHEKNSKCHSISYLTDCEQGALKVMEDGLVKYVVTRQYGDVLIGASLAKDQLYEDVWRDALTTLLYLLVIEAIIINLLNYLVKVKVTDGIHHILNDLSEITDGNLDTTVNVGGNQEFEELSSGINTMVKSIVNTTDRISKIIEMSDIPLAAFEYQNDMKHLFVTSGLKELLNWKENEAEQLYADPDRFIQKIQEIMSSPIEGEQDVFSNGRQKYIRIHLSMEQTGYLGVVTDVTKDIMEKQKMQYDNDHDQMTGLLKFQSFKKEAASILEQMKPDQVCACVMMDLDTFKGINDSYGHDVGDRYLQHFAQIMEKMPAQHCITARRSGDEFCMFLYDCHGREEIISLLQTFWNMLGEKEIELSAYQKRIISSSGGFVCTDDPESDIGVLLHQADEALYQAKNEHKGYFEEYVKAQ